MMIQVTFVDDDLSDLFQRFIKTQKIMGGSFAKFIVNLRDENSPDEDDRSS